MLYPLTFQPLFKERIWGGRDLERLYGKPLPPSVPIGESWEISDRPGDVSVIANGPLAGRDLHWLVDSHREALLGAAAPYQGRFPLLIKLLDAREKLSLQVHPPADRAPALGGEPKTEMWYIADAAPGAELYVGLRRGVTRQQFEQAIADGSVAGCFHRHPVKAGDAMFLPSGRVHAIGAGLVIFEIQQNSDTTYRVFDWNRVGLDGKPRPLHVVESLASIDFADFEPALVQSQFVPMEAGARKTLVEDPLFHVDNCRLEPGATLRLAQGEMHIIALLSGKAEVVAGKDVVDLSPGQFCLVPACLSNALLTARTPVSFLQTGAGRK